MSSLRISLVCLAGAFATGFATLLPNNVWLSLPDSWNPGLRLACVAGLVGFAVSFMVGLDRRSLVRD